MRRLGSFLTVLASMSLAVPSILPGTVLQRMNSITYLHQPAPLAARSTPSYGSLPVSFEVNRGQIDSRVRFLAHEGDSTLFLTQHSAVISMHNPSHQQAVRTHEGGEMRSTNEVPTWVQLTFQGASSRAQVVGLRKLPGTVSYFRGNDPRQWHTAIPTYAEVLYRGVYPHINLAFHGTQLHPEYDWIVQPGADPSLIKLQLSGGGNPRIDRRGNILLTAGGRVLVQSRPRIYQRGSRGKMLVSGRYRRLSNGAFGFRLGRYDRARPLVIDPVLTYSTYLGGSSGDRGLAIAADARGDAYVGGITDSSNFPIVHGPQKHPGGDEDAFVAKLNPAGTALLYSTYLGGTRTDEALAIAVDPSGDAYITGDSLSTDYPTLHPFQARNHSTCAVGPTPVPCPNAILTKINPAGDGLVYSTYLGGDSEDQGFALAIDTRGNAYVTGKTDSDHFPTVNPLQATKGGTTCADSTGREAPCTDAFVAKVSASGSSLLYSTYFGGADNEEGTGIGIDAAGSAYITGITRSNNLPTAHPFQRAPASDVGPDAFVAKLSPDGRSLVYSSYLGGDNEDQAINLAVDSTGAAYITGYTRSNNFPIVKAFRSSAGGCADKLSDPAFCIDAFVTKVNPSGSGLAYSTYLGGSGDDSGFGIAVDHRGDAFVSGDTTSTNFPVAHAEQGAIGGATDAFVTELAPTGKALVQSTYLGGSGDDFGGEVALDSADNAYLTGFTFSKNFPVVRTIRKGSGSNAFVSKLGAGARAAPTHPTAKTCTKGYQRIGGRCTKKP